LSGSALLPVHNENASVANLARTVLSCVDPARETTSVRTASLVLLLRTLIEMADPRPSQELAQVADKSVRQFIAQVNTAERDRDDDQYQARGGEKPARKAWG
jgi:hypothetical protein